MSTRRRAVDLRLEVQYAQADVVNSLRHFDESCGKFMSRIDSSSAISLDLHGLVQQLQADKVQLRQTMAKLDNVYGEMSNLDNELLKEDGNEVGTGYLESVMGTGRMRTIRGSHHADAEGEPIMPAQLEQYFKVIGDLGLLEEHLVDELPYEHHKRRRERQRKIDQDDPSITETDEEFEARCNKEIEVAHQQIVDLRIRVNLLRNEVIAAGLDPDPEKYRRKSMSESSRAETSRGVEEWLGALTTPGLEVSSETLQEVLSVAGSTNTSRPESPAQRSCSSSSYGDLRTQATADTSDQHVLPTEVGEIAAAQKPVSSQSLLLCNDTEGAPGGVIALPDQSRRQIEREEDGKLQWVVLLSPEQSHHVSSQRSDIPAYSPNGHRSSAGTKDDTIYTQSATLSSGSTNTQIRQRARSSPGDEDGEIYGPDYDITLYTFSGMIMLQNQPSDYFVRGVVFDTSLTGQAVQVQPDLTLAIAGGERTTLMVVERTGRRCIACPIVPRHAEEPSMGLDMSVVYVQEEQEQVSVGLGNSEHLLESHERNVLRVKTRLTETRTRSPMHIVLTNTVDVPCDAKVRHIGSLELQSLFDLKQTLDDSEERMYSIR